MKFTSDDLMGIANALSVGGHTFATSDLVSFGDTVIIKPGATTAQGQLLSGADVSELVGGVYNVFPLAVEYGVAAASTMDSDETEMVNLEQELSALGGEDLGGDDGDLFGAGVTMSRRTTRLRRRYSRVLARWRKNAVLAKQSGKKYRARRSGRQYKRINRIWSRMERKGIPMEGLISPTDAMAAVSEDVHRKQVAPAPRPFVVPRRSSPGRPRRGPRGRPPHPRPGGQIRQDQGLLNRQASALTDSLMSAYMGVSQRDYHDAQNELTSDVRAETVGFLFGMVEHDYFGDDDEIEILSTDPEDEEVFDDDLADMEADDAEDEAALEQEAIESSAYDISTTASADAEVDQLLSDTDGLLAEEGEEIDDEDEEFEEGASATPQGQTVVPALLSRAEELVLVPITAAQASTAARKRARLNRLLFQLRATQKKNAEAIAEGRVSRAGKTARKQVRLNQRIAAVESALRVTDRSIKETSSSGSVNYGRLRPRRPGAPGRRKAPVVIALRKKKRGASPSSTRLRHGARRLARMGGINSTGSPLDVFASEMAIYESAPTHYEVPHGYTALEAAYMLDQATEPQDYYGEVIDPVDWKVLLDLAPSRLNDFFEMSEFKRKIALAAAGVDSDTWTPQNVADTLAAGIPGWFALEYAKKYTGGNVASTLASFSDAVNRRVAVMGSLNDPRPAEFGGRRRGRGRGRPGGTRRRGTRGGARREGRGARREGRGARREGRGARREGRGGGRGRGSGHVRVYREAVEAYRSAHQSGEDVSALTEAVKSAWNSIPEGARSHARSPSTLFSRLPPRRSGGGGNRYLEAMGNQMFGAGRAFPYGAAAPFPSPRSEGEEVY